MSCGGHGYSLASGIPQIFSVMVGGCTYEGENIVMLLQLARYLMKIAADVRSNKSNVSPLAAYFFNQHSVNRSNLSSGQLKTDQWNDIQYGFEWISRNLTLRAYDRLNKLKAKGMVHELAWNEVHLDLTRASRAHTRTFLSRNFIEKVANEKEYSIREILGDLLHVYLHYEVQDCRADLLEVGITFKTGKTCLVRLHDPCSP
jgi:acyl-CoA oxidase